MADEVELTLPAKPELLSLARLTVATVASRADFDFEAVEDLRLAIDELCSPLVATGALDGRLRLRYRWDGDQIEVTCELAGASGTLPAPSGPGDGSGGGAEEDDSEDGVEERELSDRILDALVDEHGGGPGDHRVWLRKRRQVTST